MRIERREITTLTPSPYNPRKDLKPGDNEYDHLKRSIEEFGCVEPIIFNERTGRVVGGHQRLKVLIELGEQETECVIVDLPDEQEKALNIALNKISGVWDMGKLESLMDELRLADIDISLTGFEVEDFFPSEIEDDEFDVDAELSKPILTQAGDLWHLGKHTLYCGDSTEESAYQKLMLQEKAALIVTDPPYNVDYKGMAGTIKNDSMSSDKFYEFLVKAFSCMFKYMADYASIYVFHADTRGYDFRKAFHDSGLYLSQVCVWVKNHFSLGRTPYQYQHEPVLFGWKINHRWYSDRKQSTVWEFDKPQMSKEHPTMKPIPLLAYPIKNSSKSGEIVLDPFGGSGSTLIACEQTGRRGMTIELDEKYCDVIVSRYIEHVGSSTGVSLERDGKIYSYDEVKSP